MTDITPRDSSYRSRISHPYAAIGSIGNWHETRKLLQKGDPITTYEGPSHNTVEIMTDGHVTIKYICTSFMFLVEQSINHCITFNQDVSHVLISTNTM